MVNRPQRDDTPFMEDIFPQTTLGRLLKGILRTFLIKQELRRGWANKDAHDAKKLTAHPCEVVASHQWGVMWLLFTIANTKEFQVELPDFDHQKAYEMAALHDVPELVTGDYTPEDDITTEEKHRLESEAMKSIMSFYPKETSQAISCLYEMYEGRQCVESKLVKDCDRLDFIITAFVLERQGFSGFQEFYTHTLATKFSTQIAQDLADLLVETREQLNASNSLYPRKKAVAS